jgi:hypothetical protein
LSFVIIDTFNGRFTRWPLHITGSIQTSSFLSPAYFVREEFVILNQIRKYILTGTRFTYLNSALILKCKIPLKYNVATYSVFVKDVSDIFKFLLLCLLTSFIDFILYTID